MRFSLLAIMVATALAAAMVGSAIAPSMLWHAVATTAAYGSLIVALVVAFAAKKSMRAVFCIGYVIGCGLFFSATVLELINLKGSMLTGVLNDMLERKLNDQESWRIEVVRGQEVEVLKPTFEELPEASTRQEAMEFVRKVFNDDWNNMMVGVSRSYERLHGDTYVRMLDCWWSTFMGIAMGLLAVAIRRRATSPA